MGTQVTKDSAGILKAIGGSGRSAVVHAERPAEWIATEFANQSTPEAFAGIGAIEPTPALWSGAVRLFAQHDEFAAVMKGVEDPLKRELPASVRDFN